MTTVRPPEAPEGLDHRIDHVRGVVPAPVRPAPPHLGAVLAATGLAAVLLLRLLLGWHIGLSVTAGFLLYVVLTYVGFRVAAGARVATDRTMRALLYGAFVLALLPLLSLLWTVVAAGGARAVNPDFLLQTMNGVTGLHDQATQQQGQLFIGGAYHAIVGTLLITGAATLISVPVGVLAAIYLVEYAGRSRLAHVIRFFVDVMTGIPSIVAGLFAFALWAVIFGIGTKDGMAGAVALSVLMIPTVVRNSEEMLRIVPNELREASLALGVPKWRTVVKVVLPTAASGLASGVTLAIARVIGETAPLLVAVGYARALNTNLFEGPMNTLAVYAYYMFTKPLSPAYRDPSIERAWAAALLLVLVVVALNLSARLIARLFAPKKR